MKLNEQVALVVDCNLKMANKIIDYIDENWLLDWSECSKAEFNTVVQTTYLIVKDMNVSW